MADEDDTNPKPPKPDDPKDADDAVSAPAQDESAKTPDEYAALYETHIERLIATAHDDFGIEEASAVELADTVMLSFLRASTRVTNVGGWLDGAISFASEAYALREVRDPGRPRESAERPDVTLPNGVAWRDVAHRLTPRFRRVVELRYVDGRTVAEMAELLGTTERYVETLLERCLLQAAKYAKRQEGQ